MNNRKLIAAVILGLAVPAGAIELSLEENRAERGNIGYVDTQRLFKLFPETVQARENFAQAVRQAEDQINMRKADILRLRQSIGELKVERAALALSTPVVSIPAPAPLPAPIPVAAPAQAQPPAPEPLPAQPADAASLPGFGPAPQQPAQPLVINLPGATTGPVEVAPPAAPAPAPVPVVAAEPLPTPPAAAPAAPATDAQTAHAAALAAFDERISQKEAELARKEAQAREEQAGAEKNLLDLESRRSEILLGKIYRSVQEIARREGVSVVVDKTGILYGHNAVDLTEKVLKHLKGG